MHEVGKAEVPVRHELLFHEGHGKCPDGLAGRLTLPHFTVVLHSALSWLEHRLEVSV